MAGKGLMRTDYWNRVTGSVRIGDTRRDETVTDVEGFLLPYAQAGTVGLHLWGIAAGLSVTATADQPGLRVSAGSAIDAAGHLIVVSGGGVAVVDPDIDPADVANIPTVAVDTTGVILPTAADTGPRYLTVRYLEVSVEGLLGNSPALVHAPWLRLRDTTGFSDDGTDVVLARVTLDNGIVTALSAELRRLAGLPAGRLQLRRPITGTGAALTIEDVPAGELRAHPDGALDLTMLDTAGTPTRTALTLDPSGNIGIGATQPRRPLHVEGSEIHSGGPGGGFSFADRNSDSFVETPTAGERWVWHAEDGTARLWSGTDVLTVSVPPKTPGVFGGLDVGNRMRVRKGENDYSAGIWFSQGGKDRGFVGMADDNHVGFGGDTVWAFTVDTTTGIVNGLDVARRARVRQGNDPSAGIWFFQKNANADRAFVGMADDTHVGFWGNTGAGWGFTMDTSTGIVNGLDVARRARVRQGNDPSAGIWFFQKNANADRGFVGMADDRSIGFWGNTGAGWGLTMDTGSAAVALKGLLLGQGAFFNAGVTVSGHLNKSGGGFRIDHPLDPASKYLSHSFVESPEMLNVYNGTVTTGSDGHATVEMPDYFDALNRDFRYQLTVIGQFAQAIVEDEIGDNRFKIRTDKPDVKVSWQVTGVRRDAWAENNRIAVEENKPDNERNLYMHPELYNQAPTASVARAHSMTSEPETLADLSQTTSDDEG